MATTWRQADVLCPFYREDRDRRCISCEGVVEASRLTMTFGRKADFDIQMNTFCCDRYHYCVIYRMLMENKYEEEL